MYRIGHRRIDAGDIDDRRAAQSGGKTMRPDAIALIGLAVFGNDRPCNERRARAQSRRKTARDAETDDGHHLGAQRVFEFLMEAGAIASTPDDGGLWAGGDTRLGGKPRDGENSAGFYMPTWTPG